MRKNFLIVLALAFLLPSMLVLAQTDPKIGYLQWPGEYQTRNIPAGTVTDPGSHLTFIIDTGINAREAAGVADLSTVAAAAKTPLQEGSLAQPLLDANLDGQLDDGAIYQNFIAITNTHPTMAVTVHFRYFNDNCEDLLDFLVVVTCNDTLLFDPMNFVVPFSGGENTRSRMIGPAGAILEPISVVQWGSGRFVITAAASATTIDKDDDPEILFPKEWEGFDEECNIEKNGSLGGTIEQVLSGAVRNVGEEAGFSPKNLHVFNASQISFNYLIGHVTTAIPKGFITDATGPEDQFLAYGAVAWARPAVNRGPLGAPQDANINPISGVPDGDGAHALTGYLLFGSETGMTSAGVPITAPGVATNYLYLRNEVHGGDVHPAPWPGRLFGGYSLYGAIGTTPFHTNMPQDNQLIHFLSVADDYNGSNNAAVGFGTTALDDNSANISPAITTYVLQIYDNDEDIFTFDIPPTVPISPPDIQAVGVLKITCLCLRTFFDFKNQATGKIEFNGSTSVDDLELGELNWFSTKIFTGAGDFDGLLKPKKMLDPKSMDVSGGWIRFVRDNTVLSARSPKMREPAMRTCTRPVRARRRSMKSCSPTMTTVWVRPL